MRTGRLGFSRKTIRKVHRSLSIIFFIFFLVISVTGIFLGWKKHSGEKLMPVTYNGSSSDLADWLSIDSLYNIASSRLHDSVSEGMLFSIDRIDIRKDNGIAKFIFKENNWEIQVDGATGSILHIGKRYSDKIETIHDGSVIDNMLVSSNGYIKLIYTTFLGAGLLIFTITGTLLWFSPDKKKRKKGKKDKSGSLTGN